MNSEIEILNQEQFEKIRLQYLELLKLKIEKYNGFESSSIKADTAKMIMESNIYTINLYLRSKSKNNIDESIIDLYNKGRRLIDIKISVSKLLYKKVLNNLLQTNNETYNSTITKGINGFFKVYDPDYNAMDIKITADYPLYNNLIGKLEGIEFIENYLQSLYYENEFCKMFSNRKIENLLYSYSRGYKDLIINIFSIVLVQAIGCILAGRDYLELKLDLNDVQKIYEKFKNKPKQEMYNLIFDAYKKINIRNNEVRQYIEKGIGEIQVEIYNSFGLNNLDKSFKI